MVVVDRTTLPETVLSPGRLCLLSTVCVALFDQLLVWEWLGDGVFSFFTLALLGDDFREPAYATVGALACCVGLRIRFACQDWLGLCGLALGVFWIAGAVLLPVFYHFAIPWWRAP